MKVSPTTRPHSWAVLGWLACAVIHAQEPVRNRQVKEEASTETTIKISDLNELRRKVSNLFKEAPYLPSAGLHKITEENGFSGTWGKSPRDPMRLLPLFKRVRLQKGWRLVAYQWLDDIGGYVHVYGLPEGAPFPEAADCLNREKVAASEFVPEHDYVFPMPPRGTKDLGALIAVDGTPESYAEKALFLREVSEIGAYWHAIGWSDYHLIDSMDALLDEVMRQRSTPEGEKARAIERQRIQEAVQTKWTWIKPFTRDFRPHVRQSSKTTEVVWYTFSARGVESLERWTCRFENGSTKASEPEVVTVAKGTHGFMY